MKPATSLILGLWLLDILLLTASGHSQANFDVTATRVAGNAFAAQTARTLKKTPTPTSTPTQTRTATPTPTPTLSCYHDTASLKLSASAGSLEVGDTVRVTVTLNNEGCVALGEPLYRLRIQTDKPEPVFTPSVPEPVVHYLAVAPGQSDSAEFDLTAVTSGQGTLTADASYEVHLGYPGPAYWGYAVTRNPLTITVQTVSPANVSITGPATGIPHSDYMFSAGVDPITTTTPITYVWEATGQSPVTTTADLTSAVTFNWSIDGEKIITVTAENMGGTVSNTHVIAIGNSTQVFVYLPLILKPTAPPPILLASGQAHPGSLVVDSQTVYWANCGTEVSAYTDGAIMAHSKSQGISQTLVSGLSCPNELQADTDSLFWLSPRWIPGLSEFTILRLPKSGGQPVELASYTAVNASLAVDDTYVYWREYNGVVMRLPKTGGGAPQPAPVPALVFDGPDAYWLNSDGDLIRSGKDGSSAITLVWESDLKKLAGREPSAVYIMQIIPKLSEIYFTVFVDNIPGMLSCTDQATVLMRIPKSGGEYRQVAWVAGSAMALVTEPFVYFSGNCTQGILKVTLDNQTVETVVEWPEEASDLADDAVYVYWADFTNGWIKKVVK